MRGFKILSLATLLAAAPQMGASSDRPTLDRGASPIASISSEARQLVAAAPRPERLELRSER